MWSDQSKKEECVYGVYAAMPFRNARHAEFDRTNLFVFFFFLDTSGEDQPISLLFERN